MTDIAVNQRGAAPFSPRPWAGLLTVTGEVTRGLRRYACGPLWTCGCVGPSGWHEATVTLDGPVQVDLGDDRTFASGDTWDHSDIRWPVCCGWCGYRFAVGDGWQLTVADLYGSADQPDVAAQTLAQIARQRPDALRYVDIPGLLTAI